jgi:hypothetical protein
MIRIAVPNKGSLADSSIGILKEAGYRQRVDARDLVLLDPENGVIVRVNKNTQFREENEKSMREKFEVLNEVNKWKDGINKAMWIIFAALIGIIFELFFKK